MKRTWGCQRELPYPAPRLKRTACPSPKEPQRAANRPVDGRSFGLHTCLSRRPPSRGRTRHSSCSQRSTRLDRRHRPSCSLRASGRRPLLLSLFGLRRRMRWKVLRWRRGRPKDLRRSSSTAWPTRTRATREEASWASRRSVGASRRSARRDLRGYRAKGEGAVQSACLALGRVIVRSGRPLAPCRIFGQPVLGRRRGEEGLT